MIVPDCFISVSEGNLTFVKGECGLCSKEWTISILTDELHNYQQGKGYNIPECIVKTLEAGICPICTEEFNEDEERSEDTI